jgi:hypothetical protein
MDKNKLQVLRDIDYKINPCCGNCVHGDFGETNFGTCAIQSYFHLKHQRTHGLSIYRFGRCPKWERDPMSDNLEGFEEFLGP